MFHISNWSWNQVKTITAIITLLSQVSHLLIIKVPILSSFDKYIREQKLSISLLHPMNLQSDQVFYHLLLQFQH
ncbi:MAG: hypothetical protein HFG40_04200 [Bacilli bacterium]|nr:hypothetical protein [Bacilli bacterium]